MNIKNSAIFKFYTHVLNYGLGSVLPQAIGFFLIPLYVRYLTPNDYGVLEMAGSISSFCIGLMHLKIPGALTRYYYDYEDNPDELADYITTIKKLVNRVSIISSLLILTLLFFIQGYIFKGLDYWPFSVLAVLTAALSANNQLQQRLLQNKEQSKYSAILRTIFSLISIGMAVIFVAVFKWGPVGMLFSSFLVTLAFFFQAEYYLRKYLTGKYKYEMAQKSISYGLALAPAYIVGDAALLFNKTLLLRYGTMSAVGIYSMVNRFAMPLDLIAEATNTAFVPHYNKHRKENDTKAIINNVRKILIINLLVFILFLFGMPLIMLQFLTAEYHSSIPLFPIMGLAFIGKTIYHICIAEVFYMVKTRFMFVIIAGNIIFNTGLCIILAAPYKALGVTIAYSIGAISLGILSYVYKYRVSDFYSFRRELLAYLFMAILFFIISFSIFK